jgi:leucyl-tRNA synthetase
MDNFLDSAWYFLRYVSANDPDRPYDPKLIDKWLPIDMYIGGNEHAKLHLMYTRFICMGLTEAGALKMGKRPEMKDRGEPFRKFRAHGLLIKEGAKMSKSKGNVVNPDDYVAQFGADTLRMYLMFLGPYSQGGDFRDKDIAGVRRFLERVWRWYVDEPQPVDAARMPKPALVKLHQTIKKVGQDLENLSYNTAIAALMELHNTLKTAEAVSPFARDAFALMLAPLAPHFAEEIWQRLGHPPSIFDARWPDYDPALTVEDTIVYAVQVNGKVRDRFSIARDADDAAIREAALALSKIQELLGGQEPRRVIIVPNRLVNVIMK